MLLVIISSCGYTKRTTEINKNVFSLSGMNYYRLPDAKIQAIYLGDYQFSYFSKTAYKKMLRKWNLISKRSDSVLFLARTDIPPYYQSAIIKIDTSQSNLTSFIHLTPLRKAGQFLLSYRFKNFVLLFWGDNNDSIPSGNEMVEFNVIRNSLTDNLKSFAPEFYTISNESFIDSSFNSVNYLAPIIELERFNGKHLTRSEESTLRQLLSTYQSFVGNWDSVYSLNKPKWKLKPIPDPLKQKLLPGSELVMQMARQTNLLLINESHYYPQTRLTLLNSLKDLYDEGYRVLACEAVSADDTLINKRSYPNIQTGFYTNEPTFSTLLTYAAALGFKIYGYDSDPDCDHCESASSYCCANLRDANQASNIKKIMDENKNAKTIVWAGHDHIYRMPDTHGWVTMAMNLSKMGIDYKSIDQTQSKFYQLSPAANTAMGFEADSSYPVADNVADAFILLPNNEKQELLNMPHKTIKLSDIIPENILQSKDRMFIKIYDKDSYRPFYSVPVLVKEIIQPDFTIQVPQISPSQGYKIQVLNAKKILYENDFEANR